MVSLVVVEKEKRVMVGLGGQVHTSVKSGLSQDPDQSQRSQPMSPSQAQH